MAGFPLYFFRNLPEAPAQGREVTLALLFALRIIAQIEQELWPVFVLYFCLDGTLEFGHHRRKLVDFPLGQFIEVLLKIPGSLGLTRIQRVDERVAIPRPKRLKLGLDGRRNGDVGSRRQSSFCITHIEPLEPTLNECAARGDDFLMQAMVVATQHDDPAMSDDDWVVMRSHSEIGFNLLSGVPFLQEVAQMVHSHHERFDGKGYPRRLTGDEIPMGARIIAVADAFDAMTTDRPYQKGRTWQAALDILKSMVGTKWDADCVAAFERLQVRRAGGEN